MRGCGAGHGARSASARPPTSSESSRSPALPARTSRARCAGPAALGAARRGARRGAALVAAGAAVRRPGDAGPWFLLASAETVLSSSLTGLLVAAVPLVAALAGRLLGEADRLDRGRLLGLGVGLAGVAVLLGLDVRAGSLLAVGAVGLTVVGYATGPLVISRSRRGVPAVGVNAAALTARRCSSCPSPRRGSTTGCRPPTSWPRSSGSAWAAPRSRCCCSSPSSPRSARTARSSSRTSTRRWPSRWASGCSASRSPGPALD